jgi:hypothetical protein
MSGAEPSKKGLPAWAIALLSVGVFGALCFVAIVALAVYGIRRRNVMVKEAEGRNAVGYLARGVIRSIEDADVEEQPGELPVALPATTPFVPPSITQVSKKPFVSAPADWMHPTFVQAKFESVGPQWFQVQWERTSKLTGVARACADFDGDGVVDLTFELDVTCSPGTRPLCHAGSTLRELR